ncbi:MAG: hypothetical protein K1X92_06060 [Bacteroidia bacterium]|nr:hypothetical protein [Bacteroidia bacterium]
MEHAIAAKLRALTRLQIIDSNLDKIHRLRGSLPEEVNDLLDDLEGFETRKARIQSEVEKLQGDILQRKSNIETFQGNIKKYTEQQNNVKNSREFDALNKEIEYSNLEILTSEKKIRQYQDQIKQKKDLIEETEIKIAEKRHNLEEKQKELEHIIQETKTEEEKLLKASSEASTQIEERVLKGYRKIRENMRNRLAVVSIDREACGGCFAVIPPQTLIELKQRIRLIHCENCGRLLVDETFFEEVNAEITEMHLTTI